MTEQENRAKVLKGLCDVVEYFDGKVKGVMFEEWLLESRKAIAILKAQEPQWTPITFRPLTEEEKAEHPDWCYIIDSPTPDDGEDILVSDGKNVWADVWCNNGEWCSLESDHELEGVAWMKMPTPWKKEANT